MGKGGGFPISRNICNLRSVVGWLFYYMTRGYPALTEPVFTTDVKVAATRDQMTVAVPTLNKKDAIDETKAA
jgi:hypothetical protein